MNTLISLVATITLLGSALTGGVFFAFSSFVMKALACLPSERGIAAMQSINIIVINPSFLGVFLGTAVLSLSLMLLSLFVHHHSSAIFFLAGAGAYLIGTFLITVIGNIPLNDRLATLSATGANAERSWSLYLNRWTLWNHIRTLAATLAALLYALGLRNLYLTL
jgi:uncharacterized membrane protein